MNVDQVYIYMYGVILIDKRMDSCNSVTVFIWWSKACAGRYTLIYPEFAEACYRKVLYQQLKTRMNKLYIIIYGRRSSTSAQIKDNYFFEMSVNYLARIIVQTFSLRNFLGSRTNIGINKLPFK